MPSGVQGAGSTVRENHRLIVCGVAQLSVAVRLIFHVPEAEGVPVIIPVAVKASPAGRTLPLSGVSDHVTGTVPLLESNC